MNRSTTSGARHSSVSLMRMGIFTALIGGGFYTDSGSGLPVYFAAAVYYAGGYPSGKPARRRSGSGVPDSGFGRSSCVY